MKNEAAGVVVSHMDREPVQAMKERGDMIKFEVTEDESSSMILKFMEFFSEVIWRTSKQSIRVIQTRQNKSTQKGFSGIIV